MSADVAERTTELKARHYWVWGLPLVVFVSSCVIYFSHSNQSLFFVVNSLSRYTGDMFWTVLTFFADGLVSFIILLPWIKRKPQIIWAVLLAAIMFTLIGQGIKRIIDVPRPPQVLAQESFHLIGPDWGQHAFPSGHAAMIFMLAGAFVFTVDRKWLRWLLIACASLVALSRVVVGVHWPLDVLVGAAIGWIGVWVGLNLSRYSAWGWRGIGQKILGAILLAACIVLFFVDYTGYQSIMGLQRLIAVLFFTVGTTEYLKIFGFDFWGRIIGKKRTSDIR
ncbi:MAG: phosphatase PAP2 family protein [Candidatus Aminicenantes bacterium]